MRHPRITIRMLMVLIALTAIGIAGFVAAVRYVERLRLVNLYAARASHYAELELESSRTADDCDEFLKVGPRPEEFDEFLEGRNGMPKKERSNFAYNMLAGRMTHALEMQAPASEKEAFLASTREMISRVGRHSRAHASYCAELKSKYQRAASRPWEKIAADPPPPAP
jgi:hypothetical protein